MGNELLIGQTLDTNSNWIAKQVTRLNWQLERITQLRDSLETIRQGVQEALGRRPKLLITVGGLGPTHDDMTLKGVALALGKPLVLNRKALDTIKKHYRGMEGSLVLTAYRRKMATLPVGAEPLPNPVGTAPGVLAKLDGTTIISLPGVPAEMKAIFKQSVVPLLQRQRAGPPREAYVRLAGIIESALAPVLDRAQRRFPGLYFKSHPKGKETGVRSLIQLHVYSTDTKSEGRIGEAVAFIIKNLRDRNVRSGAH
ncbi:MAG TPA: molybdopterin-binding protein [Candidatus Bathyarchaeia archaeon]